MINQKLTKLYKDLLVDNKLVDTGKLYNSIQVDLFEQNSNIIVNIKGLPYIIYVDKQYKLTNKFMNSKIFVDEIGLIFVNKTEQVINDILEGKTNTIKEPNVYVKMNGK